MKERLKKILEQIERLDLKNLEAQTGFDEKKLREIEALNNDITVYCNDTVKQIGGAVGADALLPTIEGHFVGLLSEGTVPFTEDYFKGLFRSFALC